MDENKHEHENQPEKPEWLARLVPKGHREKNNVWELIGAAMSRMEEPLLSRWIEAVDAKQVDFRWMEPERDLDPDDPKTAEEKFEFKLQAYLTDEGEFSSVMLPLSKLGTYVDIPDDLSSLPDEDSDS